MTFREHQVRLAIAGAVTIVAGIVFSGAFAIAMSVFKWDIAIEPLFFILTTPVMLGVLVLLCLVMRSILRSIVFQKLSDEQLNRMIKNQSWYLRNFNGFWRWYLHVDGNGQDRAGVTS